MNARRTHFADAGRVRIAGGAADRGALVAWGSRILRWSPEGGIPVTLWAQPAMSLAAGGCLVDVTGSGVPDLVACQRAPEPALVWFDGEQWSRHVVERGVVAEDIVPAVLFGRRGVLVIHRHAQLRFYEFPADARDAWPARDLYSFYTPADQGGLLISDVDGDGAPDIYCGNYWLRAPARFELPWRLFAINTWTEEKRSGMFAMAPVAGGMAVAQSAMSPARVAVFEKPEDPTRLWKEHRLEGTLALDRPRVLLAAATGPPNDLLLCESGPAGRFVVFRNGGAAHTGEVVEKGSPLVFAFSPTPGVLIGAGPDFFGRWEFRD